MQKSITEEITPNAAAARELPAPRDLQGMIQPAEGCVNKANTKSYPQEIFEMCGFAFSGEQYILDNFASEGYRWM